MEIHAEISRSVVNATAGLLVHFMDETYIEVGFLRRNVLNIGCSGSYISGCQCMHGCEAGELMQLCQDSESNSTVASLLLHAGLRY